MSALDEKLINYGGLAHFQDRLLDDSAKSEKSTWSSEKIDSELAAKQGVLTPSTNITIDASNNISADGYFYDETKGSFVTKYRQDAGDGGQIVANTATGLGSHAEGYHTTASGDYGSHAEGCETQANGAASHAEGLATEASGQTSHAEGQYTKATNYYAHAEGNKTNATGHGSHAEGFETTAQNGYEHAEGTSNYSHTVSGSYGNAGNTQLSVGIGGGFDTEADTRKNAFEIMQNGDTYLFGIGGYQGRDTKVQDATIKTLQGVITDINTSVAGKQDVLTPSTNITIDASNNISADGYIYDETKGSFVTKYRQDAEDGGALVLNVASGLSAVAEGYGTTASGDYGSHAEGNVSVASGIASHAEGNRTQATAMCSHAEGTHTIASGKNSHAEGGENNATGSQSHAEGCYTTAQGYHCHAEGFGTIAQNFAEHSEGQYNLSHKASDTYDNAGNTQHSIGIGSDKNSRKNAFEVMQNADMYIKGVGGYDGVHIKGEDSSITVNTVQEVIAGKQDVLTAGTNISISSNTISADGYVWNASTGSFAEKYKQDSDDGGQIVANTATGLGSHAEGYHTQASGGYGSHAEGMETNASMDSAHAEGFRTTASGDYGAHAEGCWTSAIGNSSHAEGYGTESYPVQALGTGSHAEGVGRIAQNYAEHAEGMFGVSHKSSDKFGDAGNTLHSIGNSYSRNNFHNAVEVMQNGDVYITGVGGYQGTDTKVQDATIKTLQEYITALETRIATLETQIANVASNSEIHQMFNANAQA